MKKIILSVLFLPLVWVSADPIDLSLFKNRLPEVSIESVKPSAIEGLYEVQVGNRVVYLSADGQKVITGDLYDLKEEFSHTEKSEGKLRLDALEAIADKDKIIYKAKNEKYKIAIFTDISCPFCNRIHHHINAFNDAGITVEYLAFPRNGIHSAAGENMQKIWCSDDKTQALTAAKLKKQLPEKDCQGNQVAEQFALGQTLGINAAPAIILPDGRILPGYIELQQLQAILEETN
ncbi:MAG: thiol:disulfide interchange protein [Gammaproteobacteria bacterium]|nr:MAG: thiol:disulfide interchange protein [Gammaproteobacteria bacterium]